MCHAQAPNGKITEKIVDENQKSVEFARVATISYSYRFGKNTAARARQRNTGIEDEKRRTN